MSTSGASGSSRLRLSPPTKVYDAVGESNRNLALELADRANLKRFEDVDLANNERLILVSANGTRYSVVVSNAGVLSTTAI
jgi:hypothetical protein|tara:strand:- start:144 stop:386 length:243 start_codon:yes stop_codon:yes gene_type:complete